MSMIVITTFLTLIPLGAVFFIVWRERSNFHSLTPFIVGISLIALARWLDVPLQIPSLNLASRLGLHVEETNIIVNTMSDISDTVGVVFLVLGFIRTIEFLKREEKAIRNLESLLPICAWCKRIRNEGGSWISLETYLESRGVEQITHGICNECAVKMREEHQHRRSS